jgi:DNA-binding transcriptional LysR family regulator
MADTRPIERRLKLHDLKVLMSVVEAGSMGKAAGRLATSQPSVSRAIADLEHSLGVRLLDRGPQGIVPTPYGRALIKRSIAVFDELRLGVQDLEFLSDPTAGEVRIAAPAVLSSGFVAAAIDGLTRHHPRVVCHLSVDDPPRVYRRLEERDLDLAIAFMIAPTNEERMDAQVLYTDRIHIVAAASNPLSRRRRVNLKDLMNEPWALPPPDSELGMWCANAFRAAGLPMPPATVVCMTGIARVAMVARGRFLTPTIESVSRFFGKTAAIKALPIDLPGTARPVGIVTLRNRTLTPVAQLFIDSARAAAKVGAKGTSGSPRSR